MAPYGTKSLPPAVRPIAICFIVFVWVAAVGLSLLTYATFQSWKSAGIVAVIGLVVAILVTRILGSLLGWWTTSFPID